MRSLLISYVTTKTVKRDRPYRLYERYLPISLICGSFSSNRKLNHQHTELKSNKHVEVGNEKENPCSLDMNVIQLPNSISRWCGIMKPVWSISASKKNCQSRPFPSQSTLKLPYNSNLKQWKMMKSTQQQVDWFTRLESKEKQSDKRAEWTLPADVTFNHNYLSFDKFPLYIFFLLVFKVELEGEWKRGGGGKRGRQGGVVGPSPLTFRLACARTRDNDAGAFHDSCERWPPFKIKSSSTASFIYIDKHVNINIYIYIYI